MQLRDIPGLKYIVRNNSYGYLAVVFLLFVLGSAISLLFWHNINIQTEKAQIIKYQQQLNGSKSIIIQSLNQYSLLLDDGTSLLNLTNNNVSQAQWLTFFQSYNLPSNYPGVDAVSFSRYVPAADLSQYLSSMSSQGYPNLSIVPNTPMKAYAPVSLIGYVSPNSMKAMGYNQLSNPMEAAAINEAIKTSSMTMSGKINLFDINDGQPSFIIFKPVFAGPSSTKAERASSIYGFVYVAVTARSFFNGMFGRYLNSNLALRVYDRNMAPSHLIYQSPKYASVIKRMNGPIYSGIHVSFGKYPWYLRIVTNKAVLQSRDGQPSYNVLIIGVALSAVLALLVWYFTYYRERKLYWEKQAEIQAAKDELLSLASHQLRTPATIVKQYLGILLQNYGGTIPKKQQKIIQTAYDSNERQLEIANQFLNAARLGSGRIVINRQRLSLSDVTEQVVTDHQKLAAKRQQKLVFTQPKRPIYVEADPRYIPMVIENLINNAIKYSKSRSTISVKLKRDAHNAIISVKDQGIGIAEEDLPKIFDKFSRATNVQNMEQIGTGIGLYLVKQVTEMHEGNISVKSQLNKGTEFNVYIPLKKAKP